MPPINDRIPLSVQPPQWGQNFSSDLLGIKRQQQAEAEAPYRQQLLRSQQAAANTEQELRQAQLDQLRNDTKAQGGVYAAVRAKTYLDSGDTQGLLQFAQERAKNIQERGGDPSDTLRIAQLVQAGHIDEAKALADREIQAGTQLGIIKAPTNNNSQALNDGLALGYQGKALEKYIQDRGGRDSASPYFSFLPTSSGYAVGNNRTGAIQNPGAQGTVLLPVPADANVKGNVAQAEASGRAQGEAQGVAAATLPQVEASALQTLDVIDGVLNHPGLSSAVGIGLLNPTGFIPGTDATNFKVAAEQLQGKVFLQAFQQLKGAGAITEQEGSKATAAIARLSRSQSVPEYKKALREVRDVVEGGIDRARLQAEKGLQKPGAMKSPSDVPRGTQSAPQGVQEGATATNPQTGAKVIFKEGQWQPL